MLRITFLEFVFRSIPESFLFLLATYILCYKRINLQKYLISSIFVALTTYLIRMLPVVFGVHTIISTVLIILILVNICKIPVLKAIPCCLILTTILSICEFINIFVLENLFKLDIKVLFNDQIRKILYSSPSIILFAFFIFIFYISIYKNKRSIENVSN